MLVSQMPPYPDILIKKGSIEAAYVKVIKEQLNILGYGSFDIENRNFGDETEAAIKKFQKDKLLNPDGEVGPLTWHRLFTERQPVIAVATTLRDVALEFALSQLYVREKTGKNDGIQVETYLSTVELSKGNPWCMAFVYWCFEQAAAKLHMANPIYKTGHVLTFRNHTSTVFKVTTPDKGDVGVMDFGGGKGHVFIVKKTLGTKVLTVEGNTAADPTSSIEDRDGQGVFERSRNKAAAKAYFRFP